MRNGFSLVELSIVLVILGLLVGGILVGKSLIQASELRSVSQDITKVQTAIAAFRDKYFAYPGDMTNATAFWGKDAVNCNGNSGTAVTPGTCNGDGGSTYAGNEIYRFWDHLALAGLWPGNWPGVASIAAGQSVAGDNPGTNLPLSKYSRGNGNTGLGYRPRTYSAGGNDRWNSNENGTGLFVSSNLNPCCGAPFLDGGGILVPDLLDLDIKIDDGMPGLGVMQIKYAYAGSCTTTNIAATSNYQASWSTNKCPFYYDIGIRQ